MIRHHQEDVGNGGMESSDEASEDLEYRVPHVTGIKLGRSSQVRMFTKCHTLLSKPWTRWIAVAFGLFFAFMAGRMSSQPHTVHQYVKQQSVDAEAPPVELGLGPEVLSTVRIGDVNEFVPPSSDVVQAEEAQSLPFRIVISVMAYNRPQALKRALESLARARYGQQGRRKQVTLHISVDHYPLNPTSTMIRRSNIEGGASKEAWLKRAHKVYLQVLQIAETFEWPFGEKIINVRTVNGGTQGAWLQAWYPSNDNEYCFFMEDDLVVSPHYFEYLSFMIARYAYTIPPETYMQQVFDPSDSEVLNAISEGVTQAEESYKKAIKRLRVEPHRKRLGVEAENVFPYNEINKAEDPLSVSQNPSVGTLRLFGISLQRQYLVPGLNSKVKSPIPERSSETLHSVSSLGEAIFIPTDSRMPHPFLYQEVGTWGQLMFPKPWREFVQYYERVRSQGISPALPGTIAEQWMREVGSAAMWTPFHQRWAFETQSFTVYANLPFGLALSDSMRDRGVTTTKDLGPSARLALGSDLIGEGQSTCKVESDCSPGYKAWALPPLPLLERYDMCFRRIPHGKMPSTSLPIDCSDNMYI